MLFERIKSPGLAQYSYLLGDSGEALVIDPRRDCDVYTDLASATGFRIRHILETHRHEDFLLGSVELSGICGASVWHADSHLHYRYGQAVEEGLEWHVGNLTLKALHTPGHTPGSMSYLLLGRGGEPWMLFSGDTLFAGESGRVDLLGPEKMREMAGLLYGSLFEKILPLGDGVLLFPAHGYGSVCGGSIADREWTSIGLERRLNPRLAGDDRDRFIDGVAKELERPPYFDRMEKLNLEGPAAAPPPPAPLGPREFQARLKELSGAIVLDTRSELGFNSAHVPGSLSVWEAGLSSYGGWFLPYDRPLLLVTGEKGPDGTVSQLTRMGYDDLAGHLGGGLLAWHTSGLESSSIAAVTVQEFCRRLDSGEEDLCILDVRGEEELESEGRIPGAKHIHITMLPDSLGEVPSCGRLYIFCGTGRRSTIAASLLRQAGREDISVVLGGFAGWSSASCPIDRS